MSIKPHLRAKNIAIWGVVLFGAMVVWSAFLPTITRAREPANRIKCASNMRQIGIAIKQYLDANSGFYPPDLATLASNQGVDKSVFVCPSSDDDYDRDATVLVAPGTSNCSDLYCYQDGLKESEVTNGRVLLFEPLADHKGAGVNVLFVDGHVDWLDAAQARRLLSGLLSGRNPPIFVHS